MVLHMTRHGGASHIVRPDRVVRTGVLTPIVGYQPRADVMVVAHDFARPSWGMQVPAGSSLGAPPIQLMAPPVQLMGRRRGLFGLGEPGPIERARIWWQARRARSRARQFMMAGLGNIETNFVPAISMATQISPEHSGSMALVSNMTTAPDYANAALVHRRLNAWYGIS